jgi:leucyl-tRNA synthetase
VAADAQKGVIEAAATSEVNVQKFIADKLVRKIIIVPGKLVNVVVQA